jgi:hypothetical protein
MKISVLEFLYCVQDIQHRAGQLLPEQPGGGVPRGGGPGRPPHVQARYQGGVCLLPDQQDARPVDGGT